MNTNELPLATDRKQVAKIMRAVEGSSWPLAEVSLEYLRFMQDRKLIDRDPVNGKWRITPDGQDFVAEYDPPGAMS